MPSERKTSGRKTTENHRKPPERRLKRTFIKRGRGGQRLFIKTIKKTDVLFLDGVPYHLGVSLCMLYLIGPLCPGHFGYTGHLAILDIKADHSGEASTSSCSLHACTVAPPQAPQRLCRTLCNGVLWSELKLCQKKAKKKLWNFFPTPLWRLMWMTNADLCRNALGQRLHWNSLMSRWIFRWFCKVCESKKPFPQPSNSHLCGLSPVCFIKWRFR